MKDQGVFDLDFEKMTFDIIKKQMRITKQEFTCSVHLGSEAEVEK